jgi:Fic family protein
MSPYFDANKDEYIDRLFAVSSQGKWDEWIKYCLIGVMTQAQDTQTRCERLLDIQQDFNQRVAIAGGNVRLMSMIDDLFRIPVVNVPYVEQKYGISYPTARNYIDRLVDVGIIEQSSHTRRPMTFFCPRILDIIYD